MRIFPSHPPPIHKWLTGLIVCVCFNRVSSREREKGRRETDYTPFITLSFYYYYYSFVIVTIVTVISVPIIILIIIIVGVIRRKGENMLQRTTRSINEAERGMNRRIGGKIKSIIIGRRCVLSSNFMISRRMK
jgi:hypothetical protein